MDYTTVFDLAREDVVGWILPVTGLCLIAGVAGFGIYRLRDREASRGLAQLILVAGASVLGMMVVATDAISKNREHQRIREALATGRYETVEGIVTNYKPAPKEGHVDEEFDVAEHHYSFSDYVMIPGYHQSRSHGGIFRSGLRVRLADIGGHIVRIEVLATGSKRSTP